MARLQALCGGNAEEQGKFRKWLSDTRRKLMDKDDRRSILQFVDELVFAFMGHPKPVKGARGFDQGRVNDTTLLVHVISAGMMRYYEFERQQHTGL